MTIREFQNHVVAGGFATCAFLADVAQGWITAVSVPLALVVYGFFACSIRDFLTAYEGPRS